MTARLVAVGIVAVADISHTFTTGGVIVAMVVIILSGIFSLRDKRTNGWRDLYEQEREKNDGLLDEREKERVIRHSIKDELAATKTELAVERSKPDLGRVLEEQRILLTDSMRGVTSLLTGLTALVKTEKETQVEILALLVELRNDGPGSSELTAGTADPPG